MNEEKLKSLLESVAEGGTSPEEALRRLRVLPYEDLGFARVDHHRMIRSGAPEVIFCPGKTPEQVVAIAERIAAQGATVFATRAPAEVVAAVRRAFPHVEVRTEARAVVIRGRDVPQAPPPPPSGVVAVVTAGTSDVPVAEEAALTAELMCVRVVRFFDVGVAGLHRLLGSLEGIREADAVCVIAGMEGALASVVGGLIESPVIAVPTSVGYGASFRGVSALLTMLNCCAPGVAVVNIDNGYGGGHMAALIARRAALSRVGDEVDTEGT